MPFKKGDPNINRKGRIDGGVSITTEIKRKLAEFSDVEEKKTHLQLLIQKIMDKALKEGDTVTIKQIWNYVDGLPKQSLDVKGELVIPILNNVRSNDSDKENNGDEKKG